MTTRAVLYLRQSLDRLGDELGVGRQRDGCEAVCRRHGWEVAAEYVDNDVSASKPRPAGSAYARLLADVRAGSVAVVVCWDLDRLSRTPREIEDWIDLVEERGVRLVTADGEVDAATENGRMFLRVKAAFARGEVERKSRRQRDAQAQAARQGRRVGGRRPFGYDDDGMTVREDEARVIRDGFDALLAGVPLARIARDWTEHHPTPQPRRDGSPSPWTANTVRGVLTNPRYAGLRGHGSAPRQGRRKVEVVAPAVWPALVPEETWRAAVELLGDPARRRPPILGRALLSGLGLCGVCGSTIHGGRNPQGQRTYRCRAGLGKHIVRQAEPVDEWVGEVMIARLSREDAAELLVDSSRPDAGELASRALALRTRLGQLAELLADGTLTAAEVRTSAERMRRELAAVEAEQADAGRADVLGPLVKPGDVAAARAAWKALDTDRRRAVVSALATVTLLPPGRGVRTFRPDTVVIEPR